MTQPDDFTGEVVHYRSMADRIECARRMQPLRDGRRDPDSRYPSDAPDESYRLWQLAQQLADTPVPPRQGDVGPAGDGADQ